MFPRGRSDNEHLCKTDVLVKYSQKVGKGMWKLGRKEVRLGYKSNQVPWRVVLAVPQQSS